MSVQRNWTPYDVRSAFFPVKEEPLYMEGKSGRLLRVPGYKALVNAEKGATLSVVSERYQVIRNEDAFQMADAVAKGVFGGNGISDFQCYNVYMPSTRVQLPHRHGDPDGPL